MMMCDFVGFHDIELDQVSKGKAEIPCIVKRWDGKDIQQVMLDQNFMNKWFDKKALTGFNSMYTVQPVLSCQI